MGKGNPPSIDETEGFQCLGHSNWTICSPLSLFCSENFQLFHLYIERPILIYPWQRRAENGKREYYKHWWNRGISLPGAFKIGPFAALEAHFVQKRPIPYYHSERKAENEKREITRVQFIKGCPSKRPTLMNCTQKLMWNRGLSASGIQTGPLAAF